MSVVRVKHDKQNPYVMINREALWDKSLSLESVGLWARLLSRPDDWSIYTAELASSFGLHKDTINKIIRELIKNGYAARVQTRVRNKDGKYPNRFGKWEYWIFERRKTSEEISNILSETVLSGPIPSDPIKQPLLNKDRKEIPTNKKESSSSPPSRKDPPKPRPEPIHEWKRKMISYGWTDEEFEEAWRRYLSQPLGSIKNVRRWLNSVLQSIRDSEASKGHFERFEDFSSKMRALKHPDVEVSRDCVFFNCGSNHPGVFIRFDEHDFREKCEKMLEKFKIKIE